MGITENKAKEEGCDGVTAVKQLSATFRTVTFDVEQGIIKTIVDRE